jgi:hypothetical protein
MPEMNATSNRVNLLHLFGREIAYIVQRSDLGDAIGTRAVGHSNYTLGNLPEEDHCHAVDVFSRFLAKPMCDAGQDWFERAASGVFEDRDEWAVCFGNDVMFPSNL